MSLQLALVSLGIFLIVVVYTISKYYENRDKRLSTPRRVRQDSELQSGLGIPESENQFDMHAPQFDSSPGEDIDAPSEPLLRSADEEIETEARHVARETPDAPLQETDGYPGIEDQGGQPVEEGPMEDDKSFLDSMQDSAPVDEQGDPGGESEILTLGEPVAQGAILSGDDDVDTTLESDVGPGGEKINSGKLIDDQEFKSGETGELETRPEAPNLQVDGDEEPSQGESVGSKIESGVKIESGAKIESMEKTENMDYNPFSFEGESDENRPDLGDGYDGNEDSSDDVLDWDEIRASDGSLDNKMEVSEKEETEEEESEYEVFSEGIPDLMSYIEPRSEPEPEPELTSDAPITDYKLSNESTTGDKANSTGREATSIGTEARGEAEPDTLQSSRADDPQRSRNRHDDQSTTAKDGRIEPTLQLFDEEILSVRDDTDDTDDAGDSGVPASAGGLTGQAVEQPQDTDIPDQDSVGEQSGRSPGFDYPEISGFENVSQIDYWAKISGDRDVSRESVLAQYRESASAIPRSTRIYGMRIPEKEWRDMELESEDARFADIIITIQLADNNGPINEKELQQFEQVVANLSEGTGRGFSFMAPAASALQQAQCIHDFVRFYESVFVVNVRPSHSEYLEGGSINRCATQLGLEAGPGKFFVRNKTVGKKKVCLYSLANMSDSGEFDFENIRDLQTAGVTFFTKPAVNRSPGAVFSEMVDSAKAFAARIKGEAKAPNSDDLTQDDIDRIRQSIEKVAMEMENCGMAPGSEEAMRLF